ncbi:MAG: 16S rRNA (cytidine(1402)-2'-O)-methyltransferase [Gemmatimonadetes bacterium]|nr:16S rRNA (cytidine(1402)-2'-O)-methyltransferase [Gemmatimonadota bacterium]
MTDSGGGTLYVVSTPIGNLADLSARAIETLGRVNAILAEDTRHSRPLLERHGIGGKLEAYHEHNEARATPRLIARLGAGESFALISDAGTPLMSDPGHRLVAAAVAAGIRVVPVPGASALLAALVGAGLPLDRFTFMGFPPRKGGARRDWIADLAGLRHTAVVYEAPGRVGALLAELAAAGGESRPCVVARELTKQFEEFVHGTVASLAAAYESEPPRGEVVLVIGGAEPKAPDEAELRQRVLALRAEGLSAREVSRVLSLESGVPRNTAYRLAHE